MYEFENHRVLTTTVYPTSRNLQFPRRKLSIDKPQVATFNIFASSSKVVSNITMRVLAISSYLTIFIIGANCLENTTTEAQNENALAKLVKLFSKPGAFEQIDEILGDYNITEISTTCPQDEDGLECRRAEARRSVDCPRGDCYCNNCASAGPELWASCCRESLRCCSHLAAACRTCDQPSLYPFCAKHFKRCLGQLNDKKQ